MKNCWKILVILTIVLYPFKELFAQISENEIKSVYIEKFTRFIEWPDSLQIEDTSKPFIFGFLGDSKIYATLKKLYKNMTIRNKKVILVQFKSVKDIEDCHLVFIASSEKKNVAKMISEIQKFPILLIGDTKGYASKGVHINFYVTKDNVLFEINPDAVKKSNLYISHHLMRAAKIIRYESYSDK